MAASTAEECSDDREVAVAKTKEPKAAKAPKAGKGGGADAPKVKKAKAKKAKVKGALLDKVTNLVVVLFGLSLVAERLVV